MPLKKPPLKRLALILLAIVPALAWAIVKPVRMMAPEWGDVTCIASTVCVDDLSKVAEAEALYSEAVRFVHAKVAHVSGKPRVTFCSLQACADHFGLGARSAVTLGTVGTVIGPRAWKPYYVRHEVIHYVQARQLGVLPLFFKPSWFVEGMAYALSEDPRTPLAQPFEGYRSEFLSWYSSVGKEKLWIQAGRM
jgi:hypothetical protein